MRLKISLTKEPSHTAAVTCVGWNGAEEVYSAGDDNKMLSWTVSSSESSKVTEFSSDVYPTDLHFFPRPTGSLGKHGDLILLTAANGKFYIMNHTGRVERTVDAHDGAILAGRWNFDGSGILTAGEDGYLKIWSRGGMLRSTIVQGDNSVYDACWSPDGQSVLFAQGKFLGIRQLAPNSKPFRWKAHEGLILCVAWSSASEMIISGGEDCRYRIWDCQGRSLYYSLLHDYPITSLAWSPNGDLFAVGSYNTLRLCDFSGWSRSLDKPITGCIYRLSWSNDGTQLAGACANGHVLLAHIIERNVHYLNYTATVKEKKTIVVQDITNETSEIIEFPERVIQLALKFSHLIATTPTQCYIYNSNNWSTPNIFSLKDGSVILILLCEKNFLLVERSVVSVYNYQGRLIASPRWPNMRPEYLKSAYISISADTLAVRDVTDSKLIHMVELTSNKATSDSTVIIQHSVQINQLALDQLGPPSQRTLALLDRNKDLFLVQVRSLHKSLVKLANQVQSFEWNTEENMLAVIQDVHITVYYYPTARFNSFLLRLSTYEYDSPELGRNPRINNFVGNFVSIRRADGSLLNIPISPFPILLHKYVRDNKWEDALRLCRLTNDKILWIGLAVLSTQSGNSKLLEVAEEAYAAINQYDKVYYVRHLMGLPETQQMAGLALLSSSLQNAESILIHNGLVYQAILIHIQVHNWERALEMALKHKVHVDVVLYLRGKYLQSMNKEETLTKFLNLKETVHIDKEKIQQRLESELY